jgi:ribosome maturation factor RimP
MVDEERIRSVISPVVDGLGMTVVRIAWRTQGRARRLRIDLDRKRSGPVPVPYPGSTMTAGDLEEATREVSAALDSRADIPASYVLEISTPGLDRALITEGDFRDFTGHSVSVVLSSPVEGRRRLAGTIREVKGEGAGAIVVIEEGDRRMEVALESVQAANLRIGDIGLGAPRGPGHAGRSRGRKRRK